MAEQVQASLDKMVAPLADLMDRNIFSQSEIHAIVARRRESEYLLRRRMPRKADFLRYIQDELQLERLRQLRTKKQQALERERLYQLNNHNNSVIDDTNQNKSNHIGDPHIVQHIHLLFRRALMRYNREDLTMYLQYADVCKELKSFNKLPQIYAEAVQIHPHATALWIEAASHEFFHRTSVSSARILLQRALRINQTAQDLWWQSFALEFHYIAKMKGRQSVLQLEEEEGREEADNNDKEEDTDALDSTLFAVAKIVYDNAIQAIPDDVTFRLGFLDLCKTFPHTTSMEDYIVQTIRRDFKDTPKAWIARAARLLEQEQQKQIESMGEGEDCIAPKGFIMAPPEEDSSEEDNDEKKENDSDDGSGDETLDAEGNQTTNTVATKTKPNTEDPVLTMIQKALKAIPTSEMYLEAVQFMWIYYERVEEVFSDSETIDSTRQRILESLQSWFEEAAKDHPSSAVYNASLAMEHADFYARLDQLENGRQVLANYVEVSLKKSENDTTPPIAIWLQLAELTFQAQSAVEARGVLKEALKHTSMSRQSEHSQLLLQLLGVELTMVANTKDDKKNEKVCQFAMATFQKVILLASSSSSSSNAQTAGNGNTGDEKETSFGLTSVEHACLQFLLFSIETFGPLQGVRKVCKMVLLQSNFVNQLDVKSGGDVDKLVTFFDKCLEVEIDNLRENSQLTKAERKKGRVNVRQLCNMANKLFSDVPSLANQYQQIQHDALLL